MGDLRSLDVLSIDISVCATFIIPIVEENLPEKLRSSIGDSGQGVYFAINPFTNGLTAYITREEHMQIGIHPNSQHSPSQYEPYNAQFTSMLSTTLQTCTRFFPLYFTRQRESSSSYTFTIMFDLLKSGPLCCKLHCKKGAAPNAEANTTPEFMAS